MKLISSLLFTMTAIACVGAVGCASNDAGDPSDDLGDIAASTDGLTSTVVPNPSGVYVASITANGTGCPAGTWNAQISEDGQAFTVTFDRYEAILEPGKAFAVKDCVLSLDLKTPSGFSFAVSDFYYQGYALLDEEGMSVKQSAKYYFSGNPATSEDRVTEVTGPYDDSYLFSDQVGIASLVWSPCGATRKLNVLTRLVSRNNAARSGSAYINAAAIDGSTFTPLTFRLGLRWRHC